MSAVGERAPFSFGALSLGNAAKRPFEGRDESRRDAPRRECKLMKYLAMSEALCPKRITQCRIPLSARNLADAAVPYLRTVNKGVMMVCGGAVFLFLITSLITNASF